MNIPMNVAYSFQIFDKPDQKTYYLMYLVIIHLLTYPLDTIKRKLEIQST